MYKKQMTFQRIVCMALLASCVIVFIDSLGLLTDLYDGVYQTYRNGVSRVEGGEIYMDMQEFNRTLTNWSIVMILVALFNFVMGTNSRRKYYIGNYVSVALTVICNVGVSFWAITQLMAFKQDYLKIDFAALETQLATRANAYFTTSTFWFDASFVVFGIVLLVTVLLVVNLILKIMVMNSEKSLIGSRKDVRA